MNKGVEGKFANERGKRRRIREALAELLYPPRCPLCDRLLDGTWEGARQKSKAAGERAGGRMSLKHGCCPSCEKSLPWVGEPACMKCGRPVGEEGREYCEECISQEHFYDRGVAAFTYTGMLRHSVYRMKSSNRRDYIPFFAESMVRVLARQLPRWKPEVILSVPMHPKRRRRRGYNQSELLAEELSRLTGIPSGKDLLYCTRLTDSQKTLSRRERLTNLRGSFAVRGDFPAFRRVLLVDDVYTTGSTMDEISRVLKKSGVEFVFFVVLCTVKGKKAVCTTEKV